MQGCVMPGAVQGSVVMCFSGKHWIWPLKGAPPNEQLLRVT